MRFGTGKKDASPRERALWGDLMALGMVFPIAIVLGFFAGRWLGGLVGFPRAGMLAGLVWGIATGFWELYKVTVRLNRMDGNGDGGGKGGKGGDGDDPGH